MVLLAALFGFVAGALLALLRASRYGKVAADVVRNMDKLLPHAREIMTMPVADHLALLVRVCHDTSTFHIHEFDDHGRRCCLTLIWNVCSSMHQVRLYLVGW